MNKVEFENLASCAAEDPFTFAEFTKRIENLFLESHNTSALEKYRSAWFELEIVNATALADWESDGCPVQWNEAWVEKYRADAIETLAMVREAADLLWS